MPFLNIKDTDDIELLRREYEQLAQRERHLRVVHDFAIDLLYQNTVSDIVWTVAKKAIARLGFVDCVVYLMDSDGEFLIQMAAHGPKNPQDLDIKNPIKIKLGKGIVGSVAQTGKTTLIGDTSQDERYILDDDFRYSELAVPILDGEAVIGVIDSEHPEKHFFTPEHRQLLETIAAMTSSKILHAQALEALELYQKDLEKLVSQRTKDLRETIRLLQSSNRDLESFAYAASHDLAEPLRTIISFLQLVKRREKELGAHSKEYIDFAVDGAKRMKKLLDGLLSFSRAGKLNKRMGHVSIEQIIEGILADLATVIQETQARIEYKNMPHIYAHEASIIQLFQNLIANAIKFRRPDQPPKIKIFYTLNNGSHLFGIKDNGIGIGNEFYDKVFQLFGKLHTIDKYQGSGLGLALCKKILENHQGEIWFDSILDKGTTFYFTIPFLENRQNIK